MGNKIKMLTRRKRTITRTQIRPFIGVSSDGRGGEVFVSVRELSRGHSRIAAVLRVFRKSQVDVAFLKADSIQGSESGRGSAIHIVNEGECCHLFPTRYTDNWKCVFTRGKWTKPPPHSASAKLLLEA